METFRCRFSSLGLVVPEVRPRSSFRIISLIDSSEGTKTSLSSIIAWLLFFAVRLISAWRALEARETAVSLDNFSTNATAASTRLVAFALEISFFRSCSFQRAIVPSILAVVARIASWWSLTSERRWSIVASSNWTSASRTMPSNLAWSASAFWTFAWTFFYPEARWRSTLSCVFLLQFNPAKETGVGFIGISSHANCLSKDSFDSGF